MIGHHLENGEDGDPNEQGDVGDGVLAKLTQWDSILEDMPKDRG